MLLTDNNHSGTSEHPGHPVKFIEGNQRAPTLKRETGYARPCRSRTQHLGGRGRRVKVVLVYGEVWWPTWPPRETLSLKEIARLGKTLREESNPFGDVSGEHSTRKNWFMVSGKGAIWVGWSLESYSWNWVFLKESPLGDFFLAGRTAQGWLESWQDLRNWKISVSGT